MRVAFEVLERHENARFLVLKTTYETHSLHKCRLTFSLLSDISQYVMS